MKAEMIKVTPAMASEWLKKNTNNRPLRRMTVNAFKDALQRGEYIPTHQGICFSDTGVLLDGQHRLTAIAELRDGAFEMLVVHGVSDEAFKVMDIGIKRTASDALKADSRLCAVATAAASFCLSADSRGRPSPTSLIPFMEVIEPFYNEIITFCPTACRIWSSAPSMLAAVVALMRGEDVDYVKTTYRSLVRGDFSAMPPVAQAAYRNAVSGTLNTRDRSDMVTRLLYVYDQKKANMTRVQVNDKSNGPGVVREAFAFLRQPALVEVRRKVVQKVVAPNSFGNLRAR